MSRRWMYEANGLEGQLQTAHIFNDAKDRDAGFLTEAKLFPHVGYGHFLRRAYCT